MSIRRYLPPMGTAGFDRFRVSGNSRVPRPPPRMIANTSSIAIGRDLYQRSVGSALRRLAFAQRTYGAATPARRRAPGSWSDDPAALDAGATGAERLERAAIAAVHDPREVRIGLSTAASQSSTYVACRPHPRTPR